MPQARGAAASISIAACARPAFCSTAAKCSARQKQRLASRALSAAQHLVLLPKPAAGCTAVVASSAQPTSATSASVRAGAQAGSGFGGGGAGRGGGGGGGGIAGGKASTSVSASASAGAGAGAGVGWLTAGCGGTAWHSAPTTRGRPHTMTAAADAAAKEFANSRSSGAASGAHRHLLSLRLSTASQQRAALAAPKPRSPRRPQPSAPAPGMPRLGSAATNAMSADGAHGPSRAVRPAAPPRRAAKSSSVGAARSDSVRRRRCMVLRAACIDAAQRRGRQTARPRRGLRPESWHVASPRQS
jgi:hypothetical protein